MDARNDIVPATRRLLHVNYPSALLRLVEKFCQTKKFSVDSFESVPVALHHALARRYHLIVLGLPCKGLEAARFLKGLLRAKISTPVLIMAENGSKESKELGQFPNVIGVTAKPLDIHEFSKYLEASNKPPELDAQEREKLIVVLRKWETKGAHAH